MFALQKILVSLLTTIFSARCLSLGSRTAASSRHYASLVVLMGSLPQLFAHPLLQQRVEEDLPKDPKDPTLWIYLSVAACLVLLGGAFAGLTIALMGQDEIYLQVIATSGDKLEQKHAGRVLRLLKRGKHWVLVTLLLGNVITNETLPIVLDRSLGGGWPAVLGSTVLIVIFGEIIPQSVCVRYGLPIGAYLSPLVLVLMYILGPVAWPTALLLDRLLGEDHGTTYKKAGLKTLVTLHKTLGTAPNERLNQDEVTIISAVLDLKDKPVGSIMTPMDNTFTMSADTVLDEEMMDDILSAGYSRIPIHSPGDSQNFVGMLLVKMLITYDPEDALKVRDFSLATLPETGPDTSCLDIVNFFQEGKSHMVLVSQYPGENFGALGVVTLEDVIEELIGEEIIDESDVFIDVHKAIRRLQPAPKARLHRYGGSKPVSVVDSGSEVITSPAEESEAELVKTGNLAIILPDTSKLRARATSDPPLSRPVTQTRSKSSIDAVMRSKITPEMREHLKHLGPSNSAKNPKSTKFSSVKIKPGGGLEMQHMPEGLRSVSRTNSLSAVPEQDNAPLSSTVKRTYGAIDSTLSKLASTLNPFSKTSDGRPDSNDRPESRPQSATAGSPSSRIAQMARSGNIVESEIYVDGVRKVVVNVSSSSSDNDTTRKNSGSSKGSKENRGSPNLLGASAAGEGEAVKKKRRKKKKKAKPSKEGGTSENTPLLKDT